MPDPGAARSPVSGDGEGRGASREVAVAVALLAFGVLLWAGNWVIGRMIRLDAPPGGLTFARWLIAALALSLLCARDLGRALPHVRRHWGILLLLGLLASVLQHMPVYLGLQTTTATTASLLNAITPVFILLIAWVMLGERLTSLVVAGVVVSMAGAVCIMTRGEPATLIRWVLNVGDLWILLGTFSWAVYTICLRWRPAELRPMTLLWAISVFGAACSAPVALVEYGLGQRVIWSAPVVASVFYIGLCSTVLAYACWNRGVQVLGASRTGPFMYLMPVYTPMLGWLFLGETMEMFHVVGIALIFFGILLTRLAGGGAKPAA